MLVFAKVGVKGHVSKHALGRVRSPQSRYPSENSPGTSTHCRILENFAVPDLYVAGEFGTGGLSLDCRVRSSRVDLCRVESVVLWILRVSRRVLERNIVSQLFSR